MEWEELSHRVSSLEAGRDQLGLVGGDWSTGEQGSDRWRGEVSVLRVQRPVEYVEVTLEAGESVRIVSPWGDRAQLALIDGFHFDTDVGQPSDYPSDYDPGHGYTLGELSVAIEPVLAGETTVEASFRPQPTGEGFDDRPAMDASMPFAVVNATVRVAFVPVRREPQAVPVELSGELEYEPPYSEHHPVPLDLGTGGWSSFSVRVNPTEGSGDYLRALGLQGHQAWVSSSSVFELAPVTYEIRGDFVPLSGHMEGRKIQWREPGTGSF